MDRWIDGWMDIDYNCCYPVGWTIPNDEHLGGIQSLSSCDITQDGLNDILVGRDDG